MPEWIEVPGIVRRGHGVASGQVADSPYPAGTIALQTPAFACRGLDLSGYYPATLNVDTAPHRITVVHPAWQFERVKWTDLHPPETFSFAHVRLTFEGHTHEALLYLPHPETKAQHFQPETMVELLAPFLSGITYGSTIWLAFDTEEVEVS